MQQMTKKQLQQKLANLTEEKNQLMAMKNNNKASFSKENQNRLNEVVEAIVDIEEQLESSGSAKYEVPKGTEEMVHVKLFYGNRFDPKTGKETTKPSTQMFTLGEWLLFKKNYKQLGYTVAEILHDPFNVTKDVINN